MGGLDEVHDLDCGDGFLCEYKSKLTKLYTLNMGSLLYVYQVYLNKDV